MCFPDLFGGGRQPQDNSAEVARQQEEQRQARISQGQSSIDSAFADAFTPAYYDQYKTDYLNFYNPQADEQFAKAKQNLRYAFARNGTLNSSPAQAKFGDLIKSYGDARDQIAANATGAVGDLKSRVDQQKGTLYQQNATAADPSAAAASAAGSVGSLLTPQAYSPLADLFSGITNSIGAYNAGASKALPAGYAQYFTPGSTPGSASSRVTR